MIKSTYDVVIIGAGPGGAFAAKRLRDHGFGGSVLLVDGNCGRAKTCGGLLSPDAQRLLASYGLTLPNSVLSDPQIFAVETVDLKSGYKRLYQRSYLNMDRRRFDDWMLSMVPDSVDKASARCTDIKKSGNGYEIYLISEGERQTVRASRVVGADGGGSIVRRKLFASEKRISKYVSIQQHFPGSAGVFPPYACVFDPETSDSCSWLISKDGRTIFGGAFPKKNCRALFEKQKKRLCGFYGAELGEPVLTEACLLCSPRRAGDILTGNGGAYLIGEAAGFISPSSFEGISCAIFSGDALAQAFARGGNDDETRRAYASLTSSLKHKITLKTAKRGILFSPFWRGMIMKSGITSVSPKGSGKT
ncbi:MAG: FAD-binding protein [Clostridia bacterium]|nr:FAD-binding protein [Clostridia bacterium]